MHMHVGPVRDDAHPTLRLGQALRERRRHLGLSQQDLADLADVGVRLVHEVERGSTGVRLANLLRLLDALGLALALTGPGVGPVHLGCERSPAGGPAS